MSHVSLDFQNGGVGGFRDAVHKAILNTSFHASDVNVYGTAVTREMLEECRHYPNSILCLHVELYINNFEDDPTPFFEMFYNPNGMSLGIEQVRLPTTGWGSVLKRFNQELRIGARPDDRPNIAHILEGMNGGTFQKIHLYHCSFDHDRPIQITCSQLNISNYEHREADERWITSLMNVFVGVRDLTIEVIDYDPTAVAEGLTRYTDLEELNVEVDYDHDYRPIDVNLAIILTALPPQLKKLTITSLTIDDAAYDSITRYLRSRILQEPFELSIDSGQFEYQYVDDEEDSDDEDFEEVRQLRIQQEWKGLRDATVRFLKRLQFLNVRVTMIPTYPQEVIPLIQDRFKRARTAMLALVHRPGNLVGNLPVELQRHWLHTTIGEWEL